MHYTYRLSYACMSGFQSAVVLLGAVIFVFLFAGEETGYGAESKTLGLASTGFAAILCVQIIFLANKQRTGAIKVSKELSRHDWREWHAQSKDWIAIETVSCRIYFWAWTPPHNVFAKPALA